MTREERLEDAKRLVLGEGTLTAFQIAAVEKNSEARDAQKAMDAVFPGVHPEMQLSSILKQLREWADVTGFDFDEALRWSADHYFPPE